MSKELLTENLRLKFGSKFIPARLTYKLGKLVNLDISLPGGTFENKSFKKISIALSKLLYSGVKDKNTLVETLNHMVNVDHTVLKYMKTFVREQLHLEK